MTHRRTGTLVFASTLAFVLAAAPGPLAAQHGPTDGEWPAYDGDLGSTRYSPLDQIDASNVGGLEIAWEWTTRNFGAAPETRYEATPLMVDGVVYVTAGGRRAVVALDAATGETLWMYRLNEGHRGEVAPRGGAGRGVAYWPGGAGEGARIYYITPGYRLVALRAETGRPVPGFGENGVVDLFDSVRRPEGLDPTGLIGSSSPPVIVDDVVVVGSALHPGGRPPTVANIPGDVRGFDVRTGGLLWSFHTIPADGEDGAETWGSGSNRIAGNGGVWTAFTADPETGLVYLPTEAATHDYYGGHRPGDNRWTNSLIALEAKTGKKVWARQLVHHDIWDYDNPAAPVLVDVTVDGRPVQAVVQVTKQGFAYVFDRGTGEPVWPIEERPVPQSDVPGEATSATQPFPTKPPALTRQGVTEADVVDFTPALRDSAMKILSRVKLGPLFTPPVLADGSDGYLAVLQSPGSTGGANWEGASVDPETGVLYVGERMNPSARALEPGGERSEMRYISGRGVPTRVSGVPILKPPYGEIVAVDLNRGSILWRVPNADTPDDLKNNPALVGVDLGRTGIPNRAGLLTTKTLLFAGEGRGGHPILQAHDKATGALIAEIPLPASTVGIPMSYMAGGKQYVVVAVGDRNVPAELVALTLP